MELSRCLRFFADLDHVCYEITADNVRQYIIMGMLYNNNSIIPIVGGLSSVNKKRGCRERQYSQLLHNYTRSK